MTKPNRTRLRLWLSWAFVGIPLLWGILQTLRTSLELFR
ncbi:MAG: oxalate:formate antiporter [Lewinellaceae bacterium]|nr:oxalate:formate antiporter [Lewinellaceae bacterium]